MKANVTPLKNHKYNMEAEKSLNAIGSRIKEARKAKDYSLDDLRGVLEGCGVKVSRYAINKWETGETVPSAYQLIAICNALDLTEHVSYFMDRYMPELNAEGLKKIQDYKKVREKLVSCEAGPVNMPTKHGDFTAYGYINKMNGDHHVA